MYVIQVRFWDRGEWSSLLYSFLFEGDIYWQNDVVVPVGLYYTVGRVFSSYPVTRKEQTLWNGKQLSWVHSILENTNGALG